MREPHLQRIRRICAELPETSEKLSHGEPTFFVRRKAYAMCADNHHNDGHIAIWVAAPDGIQAALIATEPATYFRPAYVGVRGWVGVELERVSDDELTFHLHEAWLAVAPAKLKL